MDKFISFLCAAITLIFLPLMCAQASTVSTKNLLDPNDPLSTPSMQCDSSNTATFCDGKPTDRYNGNSCFERVTILGCQHIEGKHSPFCNWILIYEQGLKKMSPRNLCAHQKTWCDQSGYWDCDASYQSCITYNTTFQNVCMKL